jgi:uncharacterized protein YmfQ (DUF2313 family)
LPQGSAWPRELYTALQKLILGLSSVWGEKAGTSGMSVDGRAADLLDRESDPRQTIELLPEWEAAFGLPDSCLAEPLTVDDRHNALVSRITLSGAGDPAFLKGVAATIGYQIEILEHSPFMAGISQAGDSSDPTSATSNFRWEAGPDIIRQWWTVLVLQPRLSWFRAGSGEAGVDPLLQIGIFTDLECMMNRIKPAHSFLTFDYSGVLLNGALAGTP